MKTDFKLGSKITLLSIILLTYGLTSGNLVFADSTETPKKDTSTHLNNLVEIEQSEAKRLDKPFSELLEEPTQTMIICSLTVVAPYYDCSEQWEINVYSNKYSGLISCPVSNSEGLSGCANFLHGRIDLLKIGLDLKDECNRTILLHELLHMKYKDQTPHFSCKFW